MPDIEFDLPDAGGVTWSVCVRDQSGMPLGAVGGDVPLRTASVGKTLLLIETARAIVAGELSPDEPLTRTVDLWVGDSGLWHTLSVETLPLVDVAGNSLSAHWPIRSVMRLRRLITAPTCSSSEDQ